jgi:TolA-binding protein
VNNALATPSLAAAQKQALQAFLLELQRRRNDATGAAKTSEQILQAGAATGADPNAAAALVKLKLDAATAAIQKKDYPAAVNEITSNARLFTAPRDQAQALYLLAEAKLGVAGSQHEPTAWQDAALAYMRVVAHFKETPGAPYVAASLLRTAQIEEHLNDLPAAKALYDQLAVQFPTDPAATDAKGASERLKAKP